MAQSIRDPGARVEGLCSIAARLDGAEREAVVQESLDAARSIPDAHARAGALCQVVQLVRDDQWQSIVREALESARATEDPFDRCRTLQELAPRLLALDGITREELHVILKQIFHDRYPERSGLLYSLGRLRRLLFALGGHDAASEVFTAILDVGRWWP